MKWLPAIVWILFFILVGGYLLLIYPEFPNVIVARVDSSGDPTKWMNKNELFGTFLLTYLVSNSVLWFFSSTFVRYVPNWLINLPWKNYWTSSPALTEAGLARLKHSMVYAGILTNLVLFVCFDIIVSVNGLKPILGISMQHAMYALLFFTAYFSVNTVWQFRPPKQNPKAS